MKRTAKLILSVSLASILLTLTGCFSPIFYEIRKDVKPETATVSGNIPNITRYRTGDKEYLFLAADKGLRYKEAADEGHGSWGEYPLPFELPSFNFDETAMNGQQVIAVIANADTLYVASTEIATTGADGMTIPAKVNLWGRKIASSEGSPSTEGEWTLINKDLTKLFPLAYDSEEGEVSANFNFFQTNAPIAAHRHAYFCSYDTEKDVYRYYELNGTSAPVEFTISKIEDSEEDASKEKGRVHSAVYYNGAVRFFTTIASTTDETYTTEAKRIYYGTDGTLKYIHDGITEEIVGTSSNISAIMTCADAIILGKGNIKSGAGSGGIEKVAIIDGVPEKGTSEFSTNASFQITNAYLVIAMLNATPDRNETDSALYASITYFNKNGVFDNIGLWSYYPGRGNWNRE